MDEGLLTPELPSVLRVKLSASLQDTALHCQDAEMLSDHAKGRAYCSQYKLL